SQQPHPPIEAGVGGEEGPHPLDGLGAGGGGRVPLPAPRLTAPPGIEGRPGPAGPPPPRAHAEKIIAVPGRAQTVAGHPARRGATIGKVQGERERAGGDRDSVRLDGHAHMRSKRRQAFDDSSSMASSTGSRLSFATSSATRAASHGPDDSAANSPPY